MPARVAALVLAAGQAKRFGAPKLLAPLQGRPLIWHTVQRVLEADIGEIIIVSGGAHERLADALGELPVRIVQNPCFGEGLSSSLKVGITAAGQTAVLVALGDQPAVPTHVIRDLVRVYRASGKPIICPSYNGEIGNPVVLSPVVFPELMQLRGDRGARRVAERDASRVSEVSFEFDMPKDIDTPGDLETLYRSLHEDAR